MPYDEFARRLLNGTSAASATPEPFFQGVGESPVNLANATTRFFLGIRIGCAQCHPHPFNDWQQADFWGMAAFFSPGAEGQLPSISDESGTSYPARFLWGSQPDFPADKPVRQVLADWMVSTDNPNFAATAVNRTWQHLCGRGLVAGVDDLDQVAADERFVLDELAGMFSQSGFNTQWLIEGICKSKVYQRPSVSTVVSPHERPEMLRPLKTLTPEQVFDSLEQALALPIGRIDNPPRHNGLRSAFIARMDEAASEAPEDFRAGIPQALMIMNGALTANATDLEKSHTLRAVVDAPFLQANEKIEALYLATLTRSPYEEELQYLLQRITSRQDKRTQRQAYAEVFWGILNSPEFVLSR